MIRCLCLVSIFAVSACSFGAPAEPGVYTLPRGGETVIEIGSDAPMMVSFSFELGSESWDAASDCPEENTGTADDPFMLQICGGLYDENAEDPRFAAYARAMHGAGVHFNPTDGVIRVRLKNHADREMTFLVEAEPT